MADSFNIHFEDNVLVGQGYKFDKEANDNCFDFVVKENPNDSLLAKVQMEPVSYVKIEWLYGPATCLSTAVVGSYILAQDSDVPFPALVSSAEKGILPFQQAMVVTVKTAGCSIWIIAVSTRLTTMGVNFVIKL